MLTTNTDFDVLAGLAAFLHSHLHQLANAFLVQNFKWIMFQNAFVEINFQEFPPISSRLKPKVIWVRSLVPKEKNSAD